MTREDTTPPTETEPTAYDRAIRRITVIKSTGETAAATKHRRGPHAARRFGRRRRLERRTAETLGILDGRASRGTWRRRTASLSYLVFTTLFSRNERPVAGRTSSTRNSDSGRQVPSTSTRPRRGPVTSGRADRRLLADRLVTRTIERTVQQSDGGSSTPVVADQSNASRDESIQRKTTAGTQESTVTRSVTDTPWPDRTVRRVPTTVRRPHAIGRRTRWVPETTARSLRRLDDRPAADGRDRGVQRDTTRVGVPVVAPPVSGGGGTPSERGATTHGGRRGGGQRSTSRNVDDDGRPAVGVGAVAGVTRTAGHAGIGDGAAGRSEPALVIARSPTTGQSGPAGTGGSAERSNGTTPGPQSSRAQGSDAFGTRSAAGRSALGDDTSTGATSRETPDVAFPPTAIDRIVDQLSDRLARDRRIARERGGKP